MSWTVLVTLVVALGLALSALLARRHELRRLRERLAEREHAVARGSHKAQLQHPVIDLSRCLGCATCVAACPEDGVLDIVHGQAVVVHGARCVGVAACERECPVGAVRVTLDGLEERRDVPVLQENLEAVGSPGLFLAGEVTAHALIKTAIDHGAAVAADVAERKQAGAHAATGQLDLVIVGAGPAGIACALEAQRLGLDFAMLDQEREVGGTVAKYPRRKLVLTQPVELPQHGRLKRSSYTKEELMELWTGLVEGRALPLHGGQRVREVQREAAGYSVHTESDVFHGRHVCMALGRRGSPRKLGVPGEELPKVAYSLLDAGSYQGRRTLVVGGGDSAVETAMGLAEQPGNQVTLSYRKSAFFRLRGRNEERLERCVADGKLQIYFDSQVLSIAPEAVRLEQQTATGQRTQFELPNDEVFVMAGGEPPFALLERAGVSFDPALRPASDPLLEQGTGLLRALGFGLALALGTLLFALWHADYYMLDSVARPLHEKHSWLRPGRGVGLGLGIAAVILILVNLAYLLRRSPRVRFQFGSLPLWMTSHVATGILSFLFVLLHGAMAPGGTIGGRAFWALTVLLVTGAIGRYLYAYVPRAASGRELELNEVKTQLRRLSQEWDRGAAWFQRSAHERIERMVQGTQWSSSLPARVCALFGMPFGLRRALREIGELGRTEGVAEHQIAETVELARRAHRTALMAAHYEDLRTLLGSWRYLHRWVAVLMVILVGLHIFNALFYGEFFAPTELENFAP